MKRLISVLFTLVLVLGVSLLTAMPAMAGNPTAALTTPGAGIDSIPGAPAGSGTEAGVHSIVVTDATASTLTGTDAESDTAADTMANSLTGDETLSVTIAGEAIMTAVLAAAITDTTPLATVATDIQNKINAKTTVADVTVTVAGASNAKYFVITVNVAGVNNSITTQVAGTNGGETETGLGGVAPVAGTDANAVDTFTAATGSNGLWVAANPGSTKTITHTTAAGTASTLAGLEALVEVANAFINGITLTASVALTAGTAGVTVTEGAAGYLTVTGNATMTAGTTNQLTVTAYDDAGNLATAYAGAKDLTFSGPSASPDGNTPTVEGTNIGVATSVNFTAGVSDAGLATLIAYKAETPAVHVEDPAAVIDSTGDAAWDLDLTVNPAAIDHYSVSAITSPRTVGVAFNVTIQAQDQYNNNITTGGDAAENINITLGKADAGATPTSTTTAGGTVTVSMTMTVAQTGQSITFTGATSTKTGTSNNFDVIPPPIGGVEEGPPAVVTIPGVGSIDLGPYLDAEGRTTVEIILSSTDGLFTVMIPLGTSVLDAEGNLLDHIEVIVLSTPPPPPGYVLVGPAYDCLPDGAIFEPAIILTFTYDPADIPDGVSEEDLAVAYWDGDKWVALPTTVDTAANTASAEVAHFTPFAILAGIGLPAFSASDLSITPAEVDIGGEVTISLLVANTGDLAGSYEVTLKIDNVVLAIKDVIVGAGASEEVTFTIVEKEAGSYKVEVNGLVGEFTVEAPAPGASPPPAPAPPAESPINWAMLWCIVGGVVVVGLIIFFLVRRRAY